MRQLELFFLKVIRKEKKGPHFALLRFVLWLISYPYRFGVFLRNFAYDHGWYSRYSPPIPLVISVGNIVAGGAGKTPVTILIAEQFYPDTPMAVLSRGYRSEAEKLSHPVIVSQGKGPTHPASYTGDEAFLTAERFPQALVVVSKDRKKAANTAARMGAKLIVLDDGLQHRKIARDKEVVVLDVNDPYGLGYYLPRGLLREGKGALKRADLIILNHASAPEKYEQLKRDISHLSNAPIVATRLEVSGVYEYPSQKQITVKGKRIALFSGIAHPDYFTKTALGLDCEIVGELVLADHEAINLDRLDHFAKEMKALGADLLLCTEKDRVKLPLELNVALPVAWVKTTLKLVEGEAAFQTFIAQSKEALRNF
jgi:tetraacyldisaccharide 4'-kinase